MSLKLPWPASWAKTRGGACIAFWLVRRYFKQEMVAIDCENQPVAESARKPA